MCPSVVTYRRSVYFKLIAVALTMVLLYFYWNSTTVLLDKRISVGLYLFYFLTSMFDGLSTMVYLPVGFLEPFD